MVIKRKAPKAAGSRKSATAATTETVGALNLEKEFHSLRAQLGKAYEIEIEQLQKSLAKAKLQAERLAKKLLAARERQKEATAKVAARATTGAMNQLARARDAYREAAEAARAARVEVAAARQLLNDAKDANARFASLTKAMDKFEKDWSAKQEAKPKSKRKPRSTRAAEAAGPAPTPAAPAQPAAKKAPVAEAAEGKSPTPKTKRAAKRKLAKEESAAEPVPLDESPTTMAPAVPTPEAPSAEPVAEIPSPEPEVGTGIEDAPEDAPAQEWPAE